MFLLAGFFLRLCVVAVSHLINTPMECQSLIHLLACAGWVAIGSARRARAHMMCVVVRSALLLSSPTIYGAGSLGLGPKMRLRRARRRMDQRTSKAPISSACSHLNTSHCMLLGYAIGNQIASARTLLVGW